jgi:hypothetical protein
MAGERNGYAGFADGRFRVAMSRQTLQLSGIALLPMRLAETAEATVLLCRVTSSSG